MICESIGLSLLNSFLRSTVVLPVPTRAMLLSIDSSCFTWQRQWNRLSTPLYFLALLTCTLVLLCRCSQQYTCHQALLRPRSVAGFESSPERSRREIYHLYPSLCVMEIPSLAPPLHQNKIASGFFLLDCFVDGHFRPSLISLLPVSRIRFYIVTNGFVLLPFGFLCVEV